MTEEPVLALHRTKPSAGRIEVRFASDRDAEAVMRGVEHLLRELSGDEDRTVPGIAGAFERLTGGSGDEGGIIVASIPGHDAIIGLLTFSIQVALRLGGDYCLIQELWTTPEKRGKGVGTQLLLFLMRYCLDRGIRRIEVCLPKTSFNNYPQTLSFYEEHGFLTVGPRLIRDLTWHFTS